MPAECARQSCRVEAQVPFLPHCSAECALVAMSLAQLPPVGAAQSRMTVGEDVAVVHAPAWLDVRRRSVS